MDSWNFIWVYNSSRTIKQKFYIIHNQNQSRKFLTLLDVSGALDSPADNQHMALLYNNNDNRNAAIARFINEGLSRGQLCVYGSISIRDMSHQAEILALINEGEEHLQKGDLLFVDMAPIYIAAMAGDLGPFKQARDQLVELVKGRADKHIRFVGDCAGFLFKNKHFEECLAVEGWGQQKPFLGSYLCPYHKELLDEYPYEAHSKSILAIKHDLAIDADSMNIIEEPASAFIASLKKQKLESNSNRMESSG
jgi:hypothetical protein